MTVLISTLLPHHNRQIIVISLSESFAFEPFEHSMQVNRNQIPESLCHQTTNINRKIKFVFTIFNCVIMLFRSAMVFRGKWQHPQSHWRPQKPSETLNPIPMLPKWVSCFITHPSDITKNEALHTQNFAAF